MVDDAPMRAITEQIRARDGEAVWRTSALATYLTNGGLMQSRTVGRFMPRRSLVGVNVREGARGVDGVGFVQSLAPRRRFTAATH